MSVVVLVTSWSIGLSLAAWIVPGVWLTAPTFLVAATVFGAGQTILSLASAGLSYQWAALVHGSTALVLTIVALTVSSLVTHGLVIDGGTAWLATAVMVWLVTTIGATGRRTVCPDGY